LSYLRYSASSIKENGEAIGMLWEDQRTDERMRTMIRKAPGLARMADEQLDQFQYCFKLSAEKIFAGGKTKANGRVGFLLEGRGLVLREKGSDVTEISKEMSFGFVSTKRKRFAIEMCTFYARTDCTVLWFSQDVLGPSCYGMSCAGGHYKINEMLADHLYGG
jgi:hypothetical protein